MLVLIALTCKARIAAIWSVRKPDPCALVSALIFSAWSDATSDVSKTDHCDDVSAKVFAVDIAEACLVVSAINCASDKLGI